ncbi:hypothetical protein [Micromonospora sp. NPDC050495]|uniref:hypothetical protein n=1 Tax=Micromonospora sp. NPDC050495 TaxID=3154936 RepID=UPI0033F4D9DA
MYIPPDDLHDVQLPDTAATAQLLPRTYRPVHRSRGADSGVAGRVPDLENAQFPPGVRDLDHVKSRFRLAEDP